MSSVPKVSDAAMERARHITYYRMHGLFEASLQRGVREAYESETKEKETP